MASSSQEPGQVTGGTGTGFQVDTSVNLNITVEQSIQFRQIILQTQLKPVQVDFTLSIGAVVPKTVKLYELPDQITALTPEFKGYLFFAAVDGRLIVVHPKTLKVVMILYPYCQP